MTSLAVLGRVRAVWFILIFMLGACIHGWYYVTSILAAPDIPEEYARSWSFQLTMFMLFRSPIWLVVLVAVSLLRRAYNEEVEQNVR